MNFRFDPRFNWIAVVAVFSLSTVNAAPPEQEGVVRLSDLNSNRSTVTTAAKWQDKQESCEVAKKSCESASTQNAACQNCPEGVVWTTTPRSMTVDDVRSRINNLHHALNGGHPSHSIADPAWGMRTWWTNQCSLYRARNIQQSHHWQMQIANKLRYFVPSGCGGAGCPPYGRYQMVYPTNPNYQDRRDQVIYGEASTGIPMVVPLPPNVHYSYNYSATLPSSRLTRISRRVR